MVSLLAGCTGIRITEKMVGLLIVCIASKALYGLLQKVPVALIRDITALSDVPISW